MPEQLQAWADAAQADYSRSHLHKQRAELSAELAKQAKRMTHFMATGDMRPVSDIWRYICNVESELHTIDRLVAALDHRFPDETVRRRA